VIHADDIDKILDRLGFDGESIPDWCRRNNVDESAMRRIAAVYAFSRRTQTLAIDAFRVGHEARREDEPRSESRAVDGPRFAVELVVIDRDDGRIVRNPTPARDEAEGIAGTFNEIYGRPTGSRA
jgi:hypothetical protein